MNRAAYVMLSHVAACYVVNPSVPSSDAGQLQDSDAAGALDGRRALDAVVGEGSVSDIETARDAHFDSASFDECELEIVADISLFRGRGTGWPRLVQLPAGEVGVIMHSEGGVGVSYQRLSRELIPVGAARFLEVESWGGPSAVAYFGGLLQFGVSRDGDGQLLSFDVDGELVNVGSVFPGVAPIRLIPAGETMLWAGTRNTGHFINSLRFSRIGVDGSPLDDQQTPSSVGTSDVIAHVRPDGESFVLAYRLYSQDGTEVGAWGRVLRADGTLGDATRLGPESITGVFSMDLQGSLIIVRQTPTALLVDRRDYETLELLGQTALTSVAVNVQAGSFDGRLITARVEEGELRIDNYGLGLTSPQTIAREFQYFRFQKPEILEVLGAVIVGVREVVRGASAVRLFRLECTE